MTKERDEQVEVVEDNKLFFSSHDINDYYSLLLRNASFLLEVSCLVLMTGMTEGQTYNISIRRCGGVGSFHPSSNDHLTSASNSTSSLAPAPSNGVSQELSADGSWVPMWMGDNGGN